MSMIDARGLSCPQPVVLLKKALAGAPASCTVIVDNPTAKENVTRYGQSAGYRVALEEQNGDYHLTFTK